MSSSSEIETFSTAQVCEFLKQKISEIDEDTISNFQTSKITGQVFLSLSDDDIKTEIGCTLGERRSILLLINSFCKPKEVVRTGV